MLLSEKKVWKIVTGEFPQLKAVEEYTTEEQIALKVPDKRKIQKEIHTLKS